jgi:hypothetical protein
MIEKEKEKLEKRREDLELREISMRYVIYIKYFRTDSNFRVYLFI